MHPGAKLQRFITKVSTILRGKSADIHGISGDDSAVGLFGTEARIAPGTTIADISSFGIGTLPEPSHSLQLLDQAQAQARKLSNSFDSLAQLPATQRQTSPADAAHTPVAAHEPPASRTTAMNHDSMDVSARHNSEVAHAPMHTTSQQLIHPVQQAPMLPHDLLESVGRENESLRHRCEEVARKVEEAATLRQDLSVVFGHVDLILKDLERTKTALAQRNATLASERDASHDVKARHRQLLGDHDHLRNENLSLAAERQKLADGFAELEARSGQAQLSLVEKSKLLQDVTRRGDTDRERLAQIELDAQAARDELQRADDLIFSLQSDLSAARDHATLVEEDNKTLHISLADARQQIARFARKETEVQGILAANAQRIDDLELKVSSERLEHGKTRNLWQGESASRRTDVTTLQARFDAMSARAEANDRLLGEARAQMHSKVEDLRKAERRVQELQAAAAPLETKLATLEQENANLRNASEEIEALHLGLTEHTDGLTKSVRAKEREAATWKQKVDALTDRFQLEMNRNEEERERFQQTIARLGEQLEKEKLDRAMAEGALDVARKNRAGALHSTGQMSALRQAAGAERSGQADSPRALAQAAQEMAAKEADARKADIGSDESQIIRKSA